MDLKNMTTEEKQELAMNPSTPLATLRDLAKDENMAVRCRVAGNPNTPVDALRELAKDEDWEVRISVAKNPSAPLGILLKLTKDKDSDIRWRVAKHFKSSGKILVSLFEYEKSLRKPDEEVIEALYEHKNLPAFAKRVIETLYQEML